MTYTRSTFGRLGLTALALVALVATPGDAAATPGFPRAIQEKLTASAAPPCAICHVGGRVGRGTVNTPFGSGMRARGLQAYDEGSLGRALTGMESDRVDSDGDGVLDVDELRKGEIPNPPEGESKIPDETTPDYGCIGSVAPARPGGGAGVPILGAALAVLLVARRRRLRQIAEKTAGAGAITLAVVIAGSAALACASGGALASRELRERPQADGPPAMAPITASSLGDELRAVGLDPADLPPFEALSQRQLRRLMSTFTRSVGLACNDCHDRNDYRDATRAKRVTARMWNEFTRPYALAGGGAVYCDSCHHGEAGFLDRREKKVVANYMAENFTGKLVRKKGDDLECETCHGDPFDARLLAKW